MELVGAPEIGDPRIRLRPQKRGGRIVVPLTQRCRIGWAPLMTGRSRWTSQSKLPDCGTGLFALPNVVVTKVPVFLWVPS